MPVAMSVTVAVTPATCTVLPVPAPCGVAAVPPVVYRPAAGLFSTTWSVAKAPLTV